MDMSGEQRIPASREVVWQALNDPRILKACIPGCQELVKSSDTQMSAKVVLKVGPVRASFDGAVTLCDLVPPQSYRIVGEGQGGMAGFAKGEARVELEADGAETILRYTVEAQVGGKLAQLGARLIDATAKQMSAAFFKTFAQEIAARQGPAAGPHAEAAAPPRIAAPAPAPEAARIFRPAAPSLPARGDRALVGLGIVAAALVACAYFLSGLLPADAGLRGGVSADFAAAVVLILTAAVGYLFGRLAPPAAARLDADR